MELRRMVSLHRRFANRMSLKLRDLAAMEAVVPVKFAGEEFDVTYRPNVVTQKWLKGLTKVQRDAQDSAGDEEKEAKAEAAFVKRLAQLIMKWDIELEDGTEAPVNQKTLDELPLKLLNEVMNTIISDSTGDSDEEADEEAKKQ